MTDPLTIDLRPLVEPLLDEFREAMQGFTEREPDEEICTVGVMGNGFNGYFILCLNTPEGNAAHVEEWTTKPGWLGSDEHGEFCDNPADFAHWLSEYQLAGFPDMFEYDNEPPANVIGLDGQVHQIDFDKGDAELDRLIALPLIRAAAEQLKPFAELNRVAPFRIVVQLNRNTLEPVEVLDV